MTSEEELRDGIWLAVGVSKDSGDGTDPSGAAVPNVKITIQNRTTGATYQTDVLCADQAHHHRPASGLRQAGAEVLFAPGLPDLSAIRTVCAAVSKPVSFMVGIKGKSFSVGELAAAGVRRISFATSLYRAAMTGAR